MRMEATVSLSRNRSIWSCTVLLVLAPVVYAGGMLYVGTTDGTVAEVRWDDRMLPVRYVLSSQGYPESGISTGEIAAEIISAIDQINAVPEARMQLSFDGEIDALDSGGESVLGAGIDGVNLITFSDPDLSFAPNVAAVCAQTITASELVVDDDNNDLNGDGIPDIPNGIYPAGTVLDADIVFNGNIALAVSGDDGTVDIRAIVLHELGHCVGLSHSSVRDAVMFPFQSSDVASARTLKDDDIAYLSDTYPAEPQYSMKYGVIEGQVLSGISGQPIVGAHVYAADTGTRDFVVGAYTGRDGRYRIPLSSGSYLVGIEPLDGEPAGLDPERINTIIDDTTDVFFPVEFFDAAESSTDVPEDAAMVAVAAGLATTGIDIVTNTLDVLSSSVLIGRGVNYFSYPVSVPTGITAFNLLTELASTSNVQSIQRLNTQTGQFETAHLVDGIPGGYDFPVRRADGYIVHSSTDELLNFRGVPDCPSFALARGTNLIGAPCAPASYSAFDLLQDIGTGEDVISVQAYDRDSAAWLSAQYTDSDPAGSDFAIVDGGAYLVDMRVAVSNFRINDRNEGYPPILLSISPGEAVAGAIVTLKGSGFAADPGQNVVLFNEIAADILSGTTQQLVVRVPLTAVSGTVRVLSAGLAGNALPFVVLPASVAEIEGEVNKIASGQTIAGNLDSESDSDHYRFLAIEGNRITARVTTSSPGLPRLTVSLLNPLGGVLAVASNGSGQTALIRRFVAAETGFYTINVAALSGSGPYTLELSLEGVPGEPRLLVLQGDYQTGVMGTELPVPIQIVAVDETGLPASGVPISFGVAPVGQQTASTIAASAQPADPTRAMTAGDMSTLTSGILTAAVQLPDQVTGDFEIIVSAPFRTARPVTLLVSSIARPIASVEMTPAGEYDCNDGGCTVGEFVDIPYQLVFRDIDGVPLSDVLVEWAVISGNGAVLDAAVLPATGSGEKLRTRSNSDGLVEAYHRIGELVYFEDPLDGDDPTGSRFDPFRKRTRVPQQVVASVPGQPFPAVFSARAKAAAPAILRSLRSQSQSVPMGAASLGAVTFFVGDEFGNPVAGATVTGGPSLPGISPAAGFADGKLFTGALTNEAGIWSTGIAVSADGSLETPTINEFGDVVAAPFPIIYTVAGADIQYSLNVGLGPYTIIEGLGANALIGQMVNAPLSFKVRRFQRVDLFLDFNNDGIDDDDEGLWEDEPYTVMREVAEANIPINVAIRRLDGNITRMRQSGLSTTTINADITFPGTTNFDGFLQITNVEMGAVFGGVSLIAEIGPQDIEFYKDGAGSAYRIVNFQIPKSKLPLDARPVILQLEIEDPLPAGGGGSRTYPGLGLSSGIDVAQIEVHVNGRSIYGLANSGPVFPNFASLSYDGQSASLLGDSGSQLRPGKVQLVYYPTSDELGSAGPNTVVISLFFDDAGNPGTARVPAADKDQDAETITFEFSYP